MATWTTTKTTTDEPSPTRFQQVKDGALSLIFRVLRIALIVFIVMAELFSLTKVQDTKTSPAEINDEIDALIANGATAELRLDPGSDMEIYDALMTWVRAMRKADLEMEGDEAQNLWKTISGTNDGATLEYVKFYHDENRVRLRYAAGITAEVVLEFDGSYISKAVTIRQGVFNGSVLRWIYWNLIGKFVSGSPRYVSEAPITGSGIQTNNITIKKYSVRNRLIGWAWNPQSKQANESVSEHWA